MELGTCSPLDCLTSNPTNITGFNDRVRTGQENKAYPQQGMCGISSLVAPSKNLFTSMKCMRRQPASLIMTCKTFGLVEESFFGLTFYEVSNMITRCARLHDMVNFSLHLMSFYKKKKGKRNLPI